VVTLRLEGVGVRYGRRLVVEGVTTPAIEGGALTAVIGPNAAGKSSLFKRIAGLAEGPGRVELSPDARGERAVCYMPQDTGANAVLTVYESVILAARQGAGWAVADADLGRIDALLATLRIEDIAFRNLGELSGGQRQLVALAHALAREPHVLLMDEPTSALDLSRQVEVLSLVSRLARERGMAVLVALHDLNHALRFCRDVIVIADGRMAAAGPTAEVVTPPFLRRVYKVDARVEPCSHGRPHVIIDQQAV
jgi:iron complex transport system ATP-binding protein